MLFFFMNLGIYSNFVSSRSPFTLWLYILKLLFVAEHSLALVDVGAGDGGQSSSPAVSFGILLPFIGTWDDVEVDSLFF